MQLSRKSAALPLVVCVALHIVPAHAATKSSGGWVQTAKFTASNQSSYQLLGSSVAVSADGDIVVLGAPGESVQNTGFGGAVYVYMRQSVATWSDRVEVARLSASDGVANDRFGTSVAINADGDVIVVGAPNHATSTTLGTAYVFVRTGSEWVNTNETARLAAISTNGDVVSGFGEAVAMSRDGARIVVGAPNTILGSPTPATDAGAAFVYARPGGGWATTNTPTTQLALAPGTANDLFGASVAINQDGSTIVVGAASRVEDNASEYRGAGFVYVLTGTPASVITPTATLRASNTADSDMLGTSAAMDAEGTTILLGAPGSAIPEVTGDPSTTGAGFVFVRPVGGWNNIVFDVARLTASDGIADDFLGTSAALSADGRIAALGTPGYDDTLSIPNDGAAHVFFRNLSGWASAFEDYAVPAQNILGGEAAGKSVGLSEGAEVLVLGAPRESFGTNPIVNPNPRFAGAGYALQLGADIQGQRQFTEYIYAPLSYTYTVQGIPTPTLPSISGALPSGVAFDVSTGRLGGAPTTGGIFTFTLQSSNFIGYTVTTYLTASMRVISEVTITGANPSTGIVGRAYAHAFGSNIGSATWSIPSGILPPGIGFSAGIFSGTPTSAGPYSLTVQAQVGPLTSTRPVSILIYDVLAMTTASLPNALVRASYGTTLTTNINVPATWFVVSGALPQGIGLNPLTGQIGGTATQTGSFIFTVQAIVGPQSISKAYTIVVLPRRIYAPLVRR